MKSSIILNNNNFFSYDCHGICVNLFLPRNKVILNAIFDPIFVPRNNVFYLLRRVRDF